MLKKLRLKRSDDYDCHVATYHMAKMLVDYVQGSEHSLSLGSEQGISEWDDLVIESCDGAYKYLQVKRQTTNFCASNTTRGLKTKGDYVGDKQELSPLDKAFVGLSSFYKDIAKHSGCTKEFILTVPYYNVEIKKGLELRVLAELCNECRKTSATSTGLAGRDDSGTKKVIDWLLTWCEFKDIAQIFFVLNRVKVESAGDESLIRERTASVLGQCFDQVDLVWDIIYKHLHSQATDIGVSCPKHFIALLSGCFKTDQKMWAVYQQSKGLPDWQVDGLVVDSSVEPYGYVDLLWGDGKNQAMLTINNGLPFSKKALESDALVKALFRLAIHLPRNTLAEFSSVDVGMEIARSAVNGTLGATRYDLDSTNLGWKKSANDSVVVSGRSLRKSEEFHAEATALNEKMYEYTWRKLVEKVHVLLSELVGELRVSVDELWNSWYVHLNAEVDERNQFLHDIMRVNAESKSILAELRVGLLTVGVMAESIQFFLIVAVALGGSTARWDSFNAELGTKLVALRYWGGSDRDIEVRQIFQDDDDENIEMIIGREVKPVVVLPHVRSSASELYSTSLVESKFGSDSLISSKRPKLLITKTRRLNALIRNGDMEAIRVELEGALKIKLQARDSNVKQFRADDIV